MEYDFGSDVWFCHPPLPRASFGGGHGFLAARQEMHIVGGADRYRMAPIDSVLVMHLDQLTDFQACMVGSDAVTGTYSHTGKAVLVEREASGLCSDGKQRRGGLRLRAGAWWVRGMRKVGWEVGVWRVSGRMVRCETCVRLFDAPRLADGLAGVRGGCVSNRKAIQ